MHTHLLLTIPKSPYANLDQLHVLGLAILIANATQSSVQLSDRGGFYQLEGVRPAKHEIEDFGSVLDRVLRLPGLADDGSLLGDSVALHNLAGTMTVSLSSPGKRIVGSALNHHNAAEMLNQPAVDKAQKVVNRIKLLAVKRVQGQFKGSCWLSELLAKYKRPDWAAFQVTKKCSSSLSICVTIEPSLGFGTRNLVNLNQINPVNMTIAGPAFTKSHKPLPLAVEQQKVLPV